MRKTIRKARDVLDKTVDAAVRHWERIFRPGKEKSPLLKFDKKVEESITRLYGRKIEENVQKEMLEEVVGKKEAAPAAQELPKSDGDSEELVSYSTLKEKAAEGRYKLSGYEKKRTPEEEKEKASQEDLTKLAEKELLMADNALKLEDYPKAISALLHAEKYLALAGKEKFYKMLVFRDMIRDKYL